MSASSKLAAGGLPRQALAAHPVRTARHLGASYLRLAAGRPRPRLLQPTVPFYERHILADLRTPTGLSLYRYGPQDPTLDLARTLVRPGSVVVDAGANIGLFSVAVASAMGDHGTVYAFEPVARTRVQLLRNLAAAECPGVIVLPFALGSRPGPREFVAMPAGAGLSSFSPEQPELGNRVRVEVRRLDDVVDAASRARVALIKLDVEGSETEVIAGARALISTSRPMILTEVEDQHLRRQGSSAHELRTVLADLGYRRLAGPEAPNELYGPAAGSPSPEGPDATPEGMGVG